MNEFDFICIVLCRHLAIVSIGLPKPKDCSVRYEILNTEISYIF